MLANLRSSFKIALMQSNHAIESPASRHPGNSIQNLLAIEPRRHGGKFFKAFPRPVGIAIFEGKQCHIDAHIRTLAQKVVTCWITCQTKKPFKRVHDRPSLPSPCFHLSIVKRTQAGY
jgi:hypothetical protein